MPRSQFTSSPPTAFLEKQYHFLVFLYGLCLLDKRCRNKRWLVVWQFIDFFKNSYQNAIIYNGQKQIKHKQCYLRLYKLNDVLCLLALTIYHAIDVLTCPL